VSLDPLSEFIIDGFNHDQVWEELQLRNEPTVSYLRKQFKKLEKIEPEKENEEDNRQSELDEEAMFNMLMRGEGSNVDNENIGSMEDSDGDLSGLDDEDEMNKGEYSDDGEEMDEGQYSDDGEEMDELDEGEFSRDASLMDESETDHVHSVDDTEAKAVEDDFFSLEEMERFANQELDENDDIDYAQGQSRHNHLFKHLFIAYDYFLNK
jgi:U3 small nucleolar RNA-associated protein MPP10